MRNIVIFGCFLVFTQAASAGLVARYDMEQEFGNNGFVADSSPNGYDGVAKFNVQGTGGVAIFPGDSGSGVGWVKLPESVATGSEATIKMTANITGGDGDGVAGNDYLWYDADNGQDNKRALWFQGVTNRLFAELNGSSGTLAEFAVGYSSYLGKDTNIEFRFKDGGTAQLLINGNEVGSKAIASGALARGAVDSVVLGRNDGVGNQHYLGTLDNVEIHNNFIPEPATLTLFGLGALGVLAVRRRF